MSTFIVPNQLNLRKYVQDDDNNNAKKNDKQDESSSSISDLGQCVVGVPNIKGPRELCETLHFWKVEHATTVSALSIPLPPRPDGEQGLVAGPPSSSKIGDRMVLVSRNGEGHILSPKDISVEQQLQSGKFSKIHYKGTRRATMSWSFE